MPEEITESTHPSLPWEVDDVRTMERAAAAVDDAAGARAADAVSNLDALTRHVLGVGLDKALALDASGWRRARDGALVALERLEMLSREGFAYREEKARHLLVEWLHWP